eukprot:TRINITY_DN1776_c0_g1_i5.p1 TRINITY_DN1776_c0_g1~~TRINITY_DN1776_c0_g1_i5.p1  ORF type:complete len:133 (+),score=35.29 TRINITY_DN1776_c0_g1_i5:154-552(+)
MFGPMAVKRSRGSSRANVTNIANQRELPHHIQMSAVNPMARKKPRTSGPPMGEAELNALDNPDSRMNASILNQKRVTKSPLIFKNNDEKKFEKHSSFLTMNSGADPIERALQRHKSKLSIVPSRPVSSSESE